MAVVVAGLVRVVVKIRVVSDDWGPRSGMLWMGGELWLGEWEQPVKAGQVRASWADRAACSKAQG